MRGALSDSLVTTGHICAARDFLGVRIWHILHWDSEKWLLKCAKGEDGGLAKRILRLDGRP